MLQALKSSCRVTLLTWAKPDLASVNRYFGTTLRSTDFDLVLAPAWFRRLASTLPTPAAMLKFHYLFWRCRRLAPRYDVAITADNEADMGLSCGIQYVHFPSSSHSGRRWMCSGITDSGRCYGHITRSRPASAVLAERVRRNMTLVEPPTLSAAGFTKYTTRKRLPSIRRPSGNLCEVPWEQREAVSDQWAHLSLKTLHQMREIDVVRPDLRRRPRRTPARDRRSGPRGLHRFRSRPGTSQRRVGVSSRKSRARGTARLISTHRYGLHAMEAEPFGMAVAELLSGGCIPFVHDGGGQVEIVDHDPRLIYNSVADAAGKISSDPARPSLPDGCARASRATQGIVFDPALCPSRPRNRGGRRQLPTAVHAPTGYSWMRLNAAPVSAARLNGISARLRAML